MRQILGIMIPILALCIPLSVIVTNGMAKLMKLRIEEARVRAGLEGGSVEVDELRQEVHELRRELGEVQERLDFTERALLQVREQARLSDGTGRVAPGA